MSEQSIVPYDVLAAYYEAPPTVESLPGGEINRTWVVTERDGRQTVIQQLSPIFGRLVVEDMRTVTTGLSDQGWEVPLVVPTRAGDQCVQLEGASELWRVSTFIESEGRPSAETVESYAAYGDLLAQLHGSLAKIDYMPQFQLADGNFHNTEHYLSRLHSQRQQMPDQAAQQATDKILAAYDNLSLPLGDPQLIHGDPRTDNMLFRDGHPFTYIDWDTVMHGSIWVDMGDLMRSLVENSLHTTGQPPDPAMLEALSEGYRQRSMPQASPEQFYEHSLAAMQQIALELAARYMSDVVDDSYFRWDTTKFESRRDSNMARAATQWQIYQAYQPTPTGN